MLALPSPFRRRLRSEQGFTLMETLVAMVAGLLVAFAATMLLRVSLEQTERATDYVQASQLGRTALTRIVDELNSACLHSEFAPVQAESTPEKLIFVDAFSKEAEIPNSQIQHHVIEWSSEKGVLSDATSIANGGTYPEYTWATAKFQTIGTHIAQNPGEPIFTYYAYNTEAKGTGETGVAPFKEIVLAPKAKLTATEAESVSSVRISFRALPNDGKSTNGRSLDLRSQVTFAFSAPIAEPTITDEPCQ
jgi:prepilin-type N-terminal cleavage/methylation domain-containing protein